MIKSKSALNLHIVTENTNQLTPKQVTEEKVEPVLRSILKRSNSARITDASVWPYAKKPQFVDEPNIINLKEYLAARKKVAREKRLAEQQTKLVRDLRIE